MNGFLSSPNFSQILFFSSLVCQFFLPARCPTGWPRVLGWCWHHQWPSHWGGTGVLWSIFLHSRRGGTPTESFKSPKIFIVSPFYPLKKNGSKEFICLAVCVIKFAFFNEFFFVFFIFKWGKIRESSGNFSLFCNFCLGSGWLRVQIFCPEKFFSNPCPKSSFRSVSWPKYSCTWQNLFVPHKILWSHGGLHMARGALRSAPKKKNIKKKFPSIYFFGQVSYLTGNGFWWIPPVPLFLRKRCKFGEYWGD